MNDYMADDVIKAVNAMMRWILNPQEDFEEVVDQVSILCNEYKLCIDIEPNRTAIARAIVELVMALLNQCEQQASEHIKDKA